MTDAAGNELKVDDIVAFVFRTSGIMEFGRITRLWETNDKWNPKHKVRKVTIEHQIRASYHTPNVRGYTGKWKKVTYEHPHLSLLKVDTAMLPPDHPLK